MRFYYLNLVEQLIADSPTDTTKNIRGDLLIQINTHQGTRSPGDRLNKSHIKLCDKVANSNMNLLHSLLPCQTEERVHGGRDGENQGSEPERVHSIFDWSARLLIRELDSWKQNREVDVRHRSFNETENERTMVGKLNTH
jgi:hypothetical protein